MDKRINGLKQIYIFDESDSARNSGKLGIVSKQLNVKFSTGTKTRS